MTKFDGKKNEQTHTGHSESTETWSYHTAVWAAFVSPGARKEQQRFFEVFVQRAPCLRGFADVEAIIAFLRIDDEAQYERNDEIYRALIHEQQAAPSPVLFSLLVRAMLPALRSVFYGRAKSLSDAVDRDDLCSRMLTAFADAVTEYPLEAWLRGIPKNLKLNTITRLRALEAFAKRDQEALENHGQAATALLADQERSDESETRGVWDEQMVADEPPAPPHPEELSELAAALERYVSEGYLYERDVPLLFAVCGLGRPLAEVAEKLGISEEAAQKRKERALGDIRDKCVRRGRKK